MDRRHLKTGRTAITWRLMPAFLLGLTAGLRPNVGATSTANADEGGVGSLVRSSSPLLTGTTDAQVAASIVARVDDRVILLEEVLRPVRGQLQRARDELPEAKYREVEWELLRQVTESKIHQVVVLKELELKVPNKEVIGRIRKAASKDFEKYLLRLARQFGVQTREEIVARLEKEGSRLDDLRNDFLDNLLAQQYLTQLVQSQLKEPTRDELLAYYDAHREDFADEKGAVWRHIEIKRSGDPAAARRRIAEIEKKLAQGQDFAELAKKHSQGPTAINGGLWSLTSKGSYTDEAVDQAIFSLPVNSISPVIDGAEAFHIIRVEKRGDGTARPFSAVQDLIRAKLRNESVEKLRKAKLDELIARHHVESIFEQPPPAGAAR
jgi:parvulin-like peptidyl-prolyl isomerase